MQMAAASVTWNIMYDRLIQRECKSPSMWSWLSCKLKFSCKLN